MQNMKLIELVQCFRSGGTFDDFCRKQSLSIESEVIEIYSQKPFSLNSDLVFFEIEETEGAIRHTSGGIDYYNLFDFNYFQDAIEESNNGENIQLKNEEIAERLLSYAIHDA